jgi:hypothetical protein
VANAQFDLEPFRNLLRQLSGGQSLVLALPLVHPLAQRGMGRLGMTVAPIDQNLPTSPASLILGSKLGHILGFDPQTQLSTHSVKALACFDLLQQAFQTLSFLTYSRGMHHRNLLDGDVQMVPPFYLTSAQLPKLQLCNC